MCRALKLEEKVYRQRSDDRYCLVVAHHAHLFYNGRRIGIVEAVVPAAPFQLAHTDSDSHLEDTVLDCCHIAPIPDRSSGNTADCWHTRLADSPVAVDRTAPGSRRFHTRTGLDRIHYVVPCSPAVLLESALPDTWPADHYTVPRSPAVLFDTGPPDT